MSSRASFSGYLELISPVGVEVRAYPVTRDSGNRRRSTIKSRHKGCGDSIKYTSTCSQHGSVDRAEIERVHTTTGGKTTTVTEEDKSRDGDERRITPRRFMRASELSTLATGASWWLQPAGGAQVESYAVIREAIDVSGRLPVVDWTERGSSHTGVVRVAVRHGQPSLVLTALAYAEDVTEPPAAITATPSEASAPVVELLIRLMDEATEDAVQPEDTAHAAFLAMLDSRAGGGTVHALPSPGNQITSIIESLRERLEDAKAS